MLKRTWGLLLCLIHAVLPTTSSPSKTLSDNGDFLTGILTNRSFATIYRALPEGESIFLDEMQDCDSNLWFKVGKRKPLRAKRIYANSSSAGVYFCQSLRSPLVHHHLFVINSPPELIVNNPPLVDRHWSSITCSCVASLKSGSFLVAVHLLFGDQYIYTETLHSLKLRPTAMNLTSSQEINLNLPHVTGNMTCLWLVGERSNPARKWMELARKSVFSVVQIPARDPYPDHSVVSRERAITCSAYAIPPVFRCNWMSHVMTIGFVTDESGCILKIFNEGPHEFTCIAFNLIAGKVYNTTWTGVLTVLGGMPGVHEFDRRARDPDGIINRARARPAQSFSGGRKGDMLRVVAVRLCLSLAALTLASS